MAHRFSRKDEGKRVVTPSGDVIGRVTRTRDGAAFITPDSALLAGYSSRLGIAWDERRAYPLDDTQVESVIDEKIVLKEAGLLNRQK